MIAKRRQAFGTARPNDSNLHSIKDEDRLTSSRLEVHPLTVALAAPLAQFINTKWQTALLLEFKLEDDLALATARIHHADVVLNGLVKKTRYIIAVDYKPYFYDHR